MAPKINASLNSDAAKKAELNRDLAKEIRDYAKENFGASLKMKGDRLAYPPEHNAAVGRSFTGVYVRDIAAPHFGFTDDDEIESGLRCDGPGDLGVDFGYWKNGGLYIFQTKYIGDAGNLGRGEMLEAVGTDGLIRSDARLNANVEVRDLLRNFNSATPVEYFLVTNGAVSAQVKREFNEKRGELERSGVQMWLLDWKSLWNSYKQMGGRPVASSAGAPTVRIPVRAVGENPAYIDLSSAFTGGNSRPKGTVVLVARGDDIRNLYSKHRESLFHANIRGYLGAGRRINKGMEETLKNAPELFYLYNNGMSALCNGLEFHKGEGGDELECRAFQIINGAQTASTIGEFANASALKKANVLLRVTNAGDEDGGDSGLSHGIILANNSQNVIRISDFHSNDAIQDFLQKKFAGKPFPDSVPAAIYYVPKRGVPMPGFVPRRPKPKELKMDILAKALYAYSDKWDHPSKLYSQSNFLFLTKDEADDGVYWDLFGDAQGNKAFTMDENNQRRVIAIAFLRLYLDKRLKDGRKKYDKVRDSSIEYMCYCAGWHFLWAFGCVLRCFHPERENDIYKRIVDGDGLADGGFVAKWFDAIEEIILDALEAENNPDSGEILNFKIWLRSREKSNALKKKIERVRNPAGKFPLP